MCQHQGLSVLENIEGFFQAFSVNVSVGFLTMLIGLPIGFLTAAIRFYFSGWAARLVGFLIGFLRAFPVFVLMFLAVSFLASVGVFEILGNDYASQLALIVALLAYTISACSDAALTFFRYRALGQMHQAWLLIPNMFQIFVITVVDTGFGAAIGVKEAVTFTLALSESYETRIERISLLIVVILFFATTLALSKRFIAKMSVRIQQ